MSDLVTIEQRDSLLLIGINRPEKRNAWNIEIIRTVARAYTDLANNDALRVGVVFGHGDNFTAGLDLADVAPAIAAGQTVLPPELCDPWDFLGEPCPKPIVLAVQGYCYTLGTELSLASQAVIAASNTVFGQLEVTRGIIPLGGGTFRLASRLGARGMRWLLTGETFDAQQALELGLVSEVVAPGTELERAIEVADLIAANAPLAVQFALANHRAAERAARDTAAEILRTEGPAIIRSGDAMEGMAAMIERRLPKFTGA